MADAGGDGGELELDLELREDAAWVAAALVLVACLGGAVVLAEWPLWGVTPADPGAPELAEPVEGGTELWPYTARERRHAARTLGINTVFIGDPEDVETALRNRSALEWGAGPPGESDNGTDHGERVEVDPEAGSVEEFIAFRDAEGAARYTYFEADGEGRWAEESYALHAGTYLGYRLHVRAYEDPAGEWTAVQTHDEHWDWFRLRHTVAGVTDAQRQLELDFIGEPYVEEVRRLPYGNGTADSDGWVTEIVFAGLFAPLLFGVVGRPGRAKRVLARLRERRREIALGAAVFALYTGVRHAGIAAELLLPGVPVKLVGAPLYLALVVGTPALAYRLARGADGTWAFTLAVLGLGGAFVVDFVVMNVAVVPIRVLLHRGALLSAVGLVALGGAAAREARTGPLAAGLLGWAAALLAPLLGYV